MMGDWLISLAPKESNTRVTSASAYAKAMHYSQNSKAWNSFPIVFRAQASIQAFSRSDM
jgi:hypothetical protein